MTARNESFVHHVIIDANNNWNEDGEGAVKELAQQAQSYSFMHSEASNYYRRQGIWLNVGKIIVSIGSSTPVITYLGTFLSSSSNSNGSTNVEIPPTIMGILAVVCIIGIILTSMQLFICPQESQIIHNNASRQFSSIVKDITTQLLLKAPRRKEMSRFFEQVTAEYSKILNQNNIEIPDSIVVEYGEKLKALAAKGMKVSFPDNVALRCGIIDIQYGQPHLDKALLPQNKETQIISNPIVEIPIPTVKSATSMPLNVNSASETKNSKRRGSIQMMVLGPSAPAISRKNVLDVKDNLEQSTSDIKITVDSVPGDNKATEFLNFSDHFSINQTTPEELPSLGNDTPVVSPIIQITPSSEDTKATKEIVLGIFGEEETSDHNRFQRNILNKMYNSLRVPMQFNGIPEESSSLQHDFHNGSKFHSGETQSCEHGKFSRNI
jgi:hypothetical protein